MHRAGIEMLERRQLLTSTVVPVVGAQDLIYNPVSNQLLIPCENGLLARYDLTLRQLLPAWDVGTSLGGGDVTPDGRFLYVAEKTGQAVIKVDLVTGAFTSFLYTFDVSYPRITTRDVSVLANGMAYFVAGDGGYGDSLAPFGRIDMATDAIRTERERMRADLRLAMARSADRGTLLVEEGGAVRLLDGAADAAIALRELYPNGAAAVSADGSLVAVGGYEALYVMDRSLQMVHAFAPTTSFAFDPDQDQFIYADLATGDVIIYDTNTWQELFRKGEPLDREGLRPESAPGIMETSADGEELFILGNGCVVVLDKPEPTRQPDRMAVSGMPAAAATGKAYTLTVALRDPVGSPADQYRGTLHFSSSDPLAQLPADHAFTAADGGSYTFPVTFSSAGVQSLDLSLAGFAASATVLTSAFVPLREDLQVDLSLSSDRVTWGGPVLTAFVSTPDNPTVGGFVSFYRMTGQPNDPRTATQPGEAARPDDSLLAAAELVGTAPLVDGAASLAAGESTGPVWYFAVYTQSNSEEAFAQGHVFSNFAGASQRYANVVDILVITDRSNRYTSTPAELVAAASEVFWKSRTDVVLNLVGVEQLDYYSSHDLDKELTRLLNPSDGYLDEVAGLRDQYKADVVVFFAGESWSRTIGIAPVLRSLNPGSAQRSGFVVMDAVADHPELTLAHELGHVFGAAHDRPHASVRGIFPYAYGYRTKYDGVTYRDMMSYPPGDLVPRFSNPDILYHDIPLGNAKSNSARAIRETAPLVSRFRGDEPAQRTRADITVGLPSRVIRPGDTVEITATLDIPAGSPATGTVTFRDGGRVLGTVSLSGKQAVWKGTFAAVGPHEIRATYSGNGLDVATAGALLPSTSAAAMAAVAGAAITGSGELRVYGTQGNDKISLSSAKGLLTVSVNGRKQRFPLSAFTHLSVQGLAGHDRINFARTVPGATILAGDGNDTVYGTGSADSIDGGQGRDRLYGRWGDDTLSGGEGFDQLYGEDGNDVLTGGGGIDTLTGGLGANTFFTRDDMMDQLEGSSADTATVDAQFDLVHGIVNLLA